MVTFREFPNEISLCINISNCPHSCKNCHSPYLAKDIGTLLTKDSLKELIDKNKGITCVGFMGGDSNPQYIETLAKFVKDLDSTLKIGWYSGGQSIPSFLNLEWFDYIKIGNYDEEVGALDSPSTNQRFYKVENKELIDYTKLFWKNGRSN